MCSNSLCLTVKALSRSSPVREPSLIFALSCEALVPNVFGTLLSHGINIVGEPTAPIWAPRPGEGKFEVIACETAGNC